MMEMISVFLLSPCLALRVQLEMNGLCGSALKAQILTTEY